MFRLLLLSPLRIGRSIDSKVRNARCVDSSKKKSKKKNSRNRSRVETFSKFLCSLLESDNIEHRPVSDVVNISKDLNARTRQFQFGIECEREASFLDWEFKILIKFITIRYFSLTLSSATANRGKQLMQSVSISVWNGREIYVCFNVR